MRMCAQGAYMPCREQYGMCNHYSRLSVLIVCNGIVLQMFDGEGAPSGLVDGAQMYDTYSFITGV